VLESGDRQVQLRIEFVAGEVEPMTGIEPAYSAWEAISSTERVSESR
jgi:hypothetical protein